jgi:membrane-associated phospholipid phosphatase
MIFYGCLGFFIAHLLPKRSHKIIVACITGFVIFAIGISRVFLGVHWASDVLGGWALGGAVLSMVCAIFYKIHHHLKKEKITDLSRKEAFGIAILAAALGFFFIAYFVTHVTELRSIV